MKNIVSRFLALIVYYCRMDWIKGSGQPAWSGNVEIFCPLRGAQVGVGIMHKDRP